MFSERNPASRRRRTQPETVQLFSYEKRCLASRRARWKNDRPARHVPSGERKRKRPPDDNNDDYDEVVFRRFESDDVERDEISLLFSWLRRMRSARRGAHNRVCNGDSATSISVTFLGKPMTRRADSRNSRGERVTLTRLYLIASRGN